MSNIRAKIRRWILRLQPRPDTADYIARGFNLSAWFVLLVVAGSIFWQARSFYTGLAAIWISVLMVSSVGLLWLGITLLSKLSARMRWSLAFLLTVLIVPFASVGPVYFAVVAAITLCIALIAVSGANRKRRPEHWFSWAPGLIGGLAIVVIIVGGFIDGWAGVDDFNWQPMQADNMLVIADPAMLGSYAVDHFTYGPGTDALDSPYGASVRFKTATIDGSKLLDGWSGMAGWARSQFWQATAEELPVRGMVWMPEGRGPFPIVLIVHGNHAMEDYSDGGYGYLGELFASQGIITVSVDENFLNGSIVDLFNIIDGGLEEENDARGWVLLEHLRQWRDWRDDQAHALFGKVDLDRVVLIGHSRGGEAVSEAAVFNSLSAYPDDATLAFDYGFGLRGVIAVAPVDSQYHPRAQNTQMRDTSYLVIHGSHDGDVTSYAGFAAYNRLVFEKCGHCFKAGFYLLGANHGQFNSSWSRYDIPAPMNGILDTTTLMDPVQQRHVAKSLFGAFTQAVLFDHTPSKEFVIAPHRAPQWLGAGVQFLAHAQRAEDRVWADFDEDADVATASLANAEIRGSGLKLWRESVVDMKWSDTDSALVLLGWDRAEEAQAPFYRLRLSEPQSLNKAHRLSFVLSMSQEAPGDIEEYSPPESIDFTLQLEDVAGNVGQLPLSTRRVLLPQIEPTLYKFSGFGTDPASEVVVQTYTFGFDEFTAENPDLDLAGIRSLTFRFDLTPRGSIWLDDIGLTRRGG